ncbi:MAG: hypothetical protein NC243_06635 [Lachnoclostridium sp.]|nr:hypothetical protein [Lachnoclostridium sp.]MCM1384212.1 hypothetical protein [Lachnoclostridium sp.]
MKKLFFSKKVIAIILIILYVLVSTTATILYFFIKKDATQSFFEIWYYSTQIFCSIFVTGGVIIAVWQYYLASQANKKSMEIERVQKAIDLSEYYKDNILNNLPAIYYIFNQSGATSILESVKPSQYQNFDKKELDSLFTLAQIKELKNIQDSEAFLQHILEANEIFNLNLHFNIKPVFVKQDGNSQATIQISSKSICTEFMSNLINKTLNNLEYFALHFKHHTADESVVYQSLHQTYLQMITYLYYYIANSNTDPSNKLYTNVIWLYNEWMKEKEKQNKNHILSDTALPRSGTIC